jgi:FkbM family methyltransferase
MIPENIKIRISHNGRLRIQLRLIKQIAKEYPDSEYAKKVVKQFRQKFWFGSKRIKYNTIFSDAWNKLFPEPFSDIIEIGGLKFLYDDAFITEFTDIYIAGNALDKLCLELEKNIAIKILTLLSSEGPYENDYIHLLKDDIVIDAGANLGLFSLLCAQKEAKKVYAFEPQKAVVKLLEKNILLNNYTDIIDVVPLGLSNKHNFCQLSLSDNCHATGSIILKRNEVNDTEEILCVTLDNWAKENNISKIDFIKADIEGSERYMLLGATEILSKFSPRLAVCTYHLPDDAKILENIILYANPHYRIFHTSHKLFAYVPGKIDLKN